MREAALLALARLVFCTFALPALSQISPKQFVIDETRPYVYLKFDHIGDREPANDWESSKGLWLRLVNNCSLPIKISVFDVGTRNKGVGVNFEVVQRTGRRDSDNEAQAKMPAGYSVDIGTLVTIPPKGDLLISVPAESVSRQWYIRIRFNFDIPAPKGSYHPYSVVDFTWSDIPDQHSESLHPLAGGTPFAGKEMRASRGTLPFRVFCEKAGAPGLRPDSECLS